MTATVFCRCRNCGKKYEEAKSRADYNGYCSQACLHDKAIRQGYRRKNAKLMGIAESEYAVLHRAGLIGSVQWED